MRPTRFIFAAAVALFAGQAAAQKAPGKIRLAANSSSGVVLIRVPVEPFSYALQFSKNGNSGFLSRVYLMKVKPGPSGYHYIARTLSPGTYRLDSVWQQGRWSACLERGTFEFRLAAGQVEYIGTLHTDRMLTSIQRQATDASATTQRGTAYFLSHGGTEPPVIDDRDEAGLSAARAFADAEMNGTGSLVRVAAVTETAFATSGAGKAIKTCG